MVIDYGVDLGHCEAFDPLGMMTAPDFYINIQAQSNIDHAMIKRMCSDEYIFILLLESMQKRY